MKTLVINGSPRNGNTKDLLDAFMKGAKDAEISYVDLGKSSVLPCEACDACGKLGNRCKHTDATNEIIEKILTSDAIVFGTPVYWWGISAQLKALIDKLYVFNSINYNIPKKKIGLITVGAMETTGKQYELISGQYQCIFDFLKWDICFDESYSAYYIGDIKKNTAALDRTAELYQRLN